METSINCFYAKRNTVTNIRHTLYFFQALRFWSSIALRSQIYRKTLGGCFDIPATIIEQKDLNTYLVCYDGQNNRRKLDLIAVHRIKTLSEWAHRDMSSSCRRHQCSRIRGSSSSPGNEIVAGCIPFFLLSTPNHFRLLFKGSSVQFPTPLRKLTRIKLHQDIMEINLFTFIRTL